MTLAEQSLAELNRDIAAALAAWEQLFVAPESPAPDVLHAIVAGERMAGVLTRVQVLSDLVIQRNKESMRTDQ